MLSNSSSTGRITFLFLFLCGEDELSSLFTELCFYSLKPPFQYREQPPPFSSVGVWAWAAVSDMFTGWELTGAAASQSSCCHIASLDRSEFDLMDPVFSSWKVTTP